MVFMLKLDKNDGKYWCFLDGKVLRLLIDCKNGGLFKEVVLEVVRWIKWIKEVWIKG